MKQFYKIADELRRLADGLENLAAAYDTNPPQKAVSPETPPAEPDAVDVTIEEIRAVLAAKSQQGKREAVKALISKCGVDKLTDVPTSMYGNLLAQAEGL